MHERATSEFSSHVNGFCFLTCRKLRSSIISYPLVVLVGQARIAIICILLLPFDSFYAKFASFQLLKTMPFERKFEQK